MPGNHGRFIDETETVRVQHVDIHFQQHLCETAAPFFHRSRVVDVDEAVTDTVTRHVLRMRGGLQHRNPDTGARHQFRDVRQRRPMFEQLLYAEVGRCGLEIELRHVHGQAAYNPETCGMRRCTMRLAKSSSHGRSYLRKR